VDWEEKSVGIEHRGRVSGDQTVTVQPQTNPGRVLGTVGYMAPEQVRGQVADARSDIFAVGVILYEMLTGKPAFRKSTSAETMTAILNEDPTAVSQIAPTVPPGLQRIVNRCLAKSPDKRFQHASDLEFAMEALSDSSGSSVSGVHEGLPSKRWIWLATTIAIALAAAVVMWWREPPAVPVVQAVTQLTDDGEPKWIYHNLLTDGSRIYFNEGPSFSMKIAQVAVSGGPTAIIPTRFAMPELIGLDPEGSSLLALVGGPNSETPRSWWMIPLPTGEPRQLGNFEAEDGGFTTDGRILFCKGNDLYIAEKDGSNARKLLSADGRIEQPSVSPDGKHLVFTVYLSLTSALVVSNIDGSGRHVIVDPGEGRLVWRARWTPDGRYIVFQDENGGRPDLWVAQWQTGFLQRFHPPVQLTNGPLS
jgi:eukaryotic-like serine/threonine-protein kinase